MINRQLYEALRQYTKTAFEILNKKIRGPEELPKALYEKHEVIQPGGFRSAYATRIEWWRLVDGIGSSLKQLDVYRVATREMGSDVSVAKHLNTLVGVESRGRVDCDICLRSLLTNQLQEQQGINFQSEIFDRIYQKIEDYFYRETLEYRYLAHLDAFQMDAPKIELAPQFSIIKVSKEDQEAILSQYSQFALYSPHRVLPLSGYAFELYLESPKIFGDAPSPQGRMPSEIVRHAFDDACLALRLFKSGGVGYSQIDIMAISWEHYGATRSLSFGPISSAPLPGSPYELANTDIPAFLDFWRFFQKQRQKKQDRIEMALRRFNFGYERFRPEDKLIDFVIAFEALLLDQEQELSYRLALRGAALVGRNADERTTVYKELQQAYRQRSRAVHGHAANENVTIGGETVSFNEFVVRIEERLRFALKAFLVLSEKQSEQQILESLDEGIVRGF